MDLKRIIAEKVFRQFVVANIAKQICQGPACKKVRILRVFLLDDAGYRRA